MILQNKNSYIGLHKFPVFKEDTSPTSFDYLRLDSVPDELTSGRNLIKITGNVSKFKPNVPIYVEVLDSSGNNLFVEYFDYYDTLKRRLIVIHVNETIAPGPCLITICGVLNDNLVPANFVNKINFRWQKKVNVVINKPNGSEIIYQTPPSVVLQTRVRPFVTASYRNDEEMIVREYGHIRFLDYNFGDHIGDADAASTIIQRKKAFSILPASTDPSITSFTRETVYHLRDLNYSAKQLATNFSSLSPQGGQFACFGSNAIYDYNFSKNEGWELVTGSSDITINRVNYAGRDYVIQSEQAIPAAQWVSGSGIDFNLGPGFDSTKTYLLVFDARWNTIDPMLPAGNYQVTASLATWDDPTEVPTTVMWLAGLGPDMGTWVTYAGIMRSDTMRNCLRLRTSLYYGAQLQLDNVRLYPLDQISTDFNFNSDLIGGYIKVNNPDIRPGTSSADELIVDDPTYKAYIDSVLNTSTAAADSRFYYELVDRNSKSNPITYLTKLHRIHEFTSRNILGHQSIIGVADDRELVTDNFIPDYNIALPFGFVQGYDDHLYAVSQTGGSSLSGSIFKYDIDTNTLSTIASFPSSKAWPKYQMEYITNNPDSTKNGFWGVTFIGGTFNVGTIFFCKRDPISYAYTLSFPFSFFSGSTNYLSGFYAGPPAASSDGQYLYGVTTRGGSNNKGTLYRYKLGSWFQYLKQFETGSSISDLVGIVAEVIYPSKVLEYSGSLWGMRPRGGLNNSGSIFKYNLATGIYSESFSFPLITATSGGYTPAGGLILGPDGYLYGTTVNTSTSANGGTIFRYSASNGTVETLYTFDSATELSTITAPMIYDNGKFYGVGSAGNASGNGAVFSFSGSSVEIFPTSVDDPTENPVGGLIRKGDYLYGTTTDGGGTGNGGVYRISRTGTTSPYIDVPALQIYHRNSIIPAPVPSSQTLILDYPRWTGAIASNADANSMYSVVQLDLDNLEPMSGDVSKIRISAKTKGMKGEFVDLGEYSVTPTDLLLDFRYVNHVSHIDSPYRLTGYFKPVISKYLTSTLESRNLRDNAYVNGWNTGSITTNYFTGTPIHVSMSFTSNPAADKPNDASVARVYVDFNPGAPALAYMVYTASSIPPGTSSLNTYQQVSYELLSAYPMLNIMESASLAYYTSSAGYDKLGLNALIAYPAIFKNTSSLTYDDIYAIAPNVSSNYRFSSGSTSYVSGSGGSLPFKYHNKLGWSTEEFYLSGSYIGSSPLYMGMLFQWNHESVDLMNTTIDENNPHLVEIGNILSKEIGDREYIMNFYWESSSFASSPGYSTVSTPQTTNGNEVLMDSVKISSTTDSKYAAIINKNKNLFYNSDPISFTPGTTYLLSFNAVSKISTVEAIGTQILSNNFTAGNTTDWACNASSEWTISNGNYASYKINTYNSGSISINTGSLTPSYANNVWLNSGVTTFGIGYYKLDISLGAFTFSTFKNPIDIEITWNGTSKVLTDIQPLTTYSIILYNSTNTANRPTITFKNTLLGASSDEKIHILNLSLKAYSYYAEPGQSNTGSYTANRDANILPTESKLIVYGINTSIGVPFKDVRSLDPGEFIGELEHKLEYGQSGEVKNYERVEMEFQSETPGSGQIGFAADPNSDWYISDISIKPKDRVGITPKTSRIYVKIPNELVNTALTFKIEYLNDYDTKAEYNTIMTDIMFTNTNEQGVDAGGSIPSNTAPLTDQIGSEIRTPGDDLVGSGSLN
jgi:uncharacterized repeat protein (TIGR03803 family)